MTPREQVVALALEEVGYLEKDANANLDDKTAGAGRGNFTKYARDLDALGDVFNGRKNGFEWCAVFVVWLFVRTFGAETALKMLYLPRRSLAAGVKYLAGYFKNAGQFVTKTPQPGDVVFFYKSDLASFAHTGLVERVEGGRVYTVEGNTSKASGVVANGGGVARKNYALSYKRIAGYGRPDWSLAPEDKDERGDEDEMTGEEIYRKLVEYTSALKLPDWAEEEFAEAVELGITDGSDPMGLIPRYQAAIMARRAAQK